MASPSCPLRKLAGFGMLVDVHVYVEFPVIFFFPDSFPHIRLFTSLLSLPLPHGGRGRGGAAASPLRAPPSLPSPSPPSLPPRNPQCASTSPLDLPSLSSHTT